jgi:hypothetical protein
MRLAAVAVVLPLLAACGYRSGSYRFIGVDFPTTARHTAGCLDVGIGPHHGSRDFAPVVVYALGNRCDRDIDVDFSAAQVYGETAAGERIPLVARDPRREIGPRTIAASWSGRAAIEYMPAQRGARPVFVAVCVTVPSLAASQICFDPGVGGPS